MLLLLPMLASAAGIGKINVKSALGEPLKAEVEVFVSDSNELDLAVARLGSMQDYADAGIADAYVSGVNANIIKKSNGRYAIELQSNQAVNEPYLELLVKLDTKTSNLMRQYTVLLDPPMSALNDEPSQETRVSSGTIATKASIKKSKRSDATRDDKVVSPTDSGQNDTAALVSPSVEATRQISTPKTHQAPTGRVNASDETYVAQAGDVFGKIAQRYQPEGVPLVKVMAAFYALNKSAFIAGDVQRLKAGSVIRIPDQESLNGTGRLKAAQPVAKQEQVSLPAASQDPAREVTHPPIKEYKQESKPAADLAKAEPTPQTDKNVSENPTKGDTNYVLKVSPGDTSVSTSRPAPPPMTDLSKASKDGTGQAGAEKGIATSTGTATVQSADQTHSNNGLATTANKRVADTSFTETLQTYWTTIFLLFGLLLISFVAWFSYNKKRSSVKDLRGHFNSIFGEEILPIEPPTPVTHSLNPEPEIAKAYEETHTDKAFGSPLSSANAEHEEIKREFSEPHARPNAKPADPLIEAELYMTYGRHKQAETILTSVDTPYKLELSLGLLKIYADRKDKVAFERIVHSIHDDLASGSIEDAMIWSKVVALGAKIDPENPLYGGASKVAKLSTRERAAAAERAMHESLMPFDDDSLLLPDTPPPLETLPEISSSPKEEPQSKVEQTLEFESIKAEVLNTSDAVEKVITPDKTNEIEFTLEDMKMSELSTKVPDSAAGTEITNSEVEAEDVNVLFEKIKDEK